MKSLFTTTAVVGALLLAACGGGGSNHSPRNDPVPPPKPVLKIFGDSLMDSGTFGFKVTVQNADKSKPFEVFPEKMATALGANTPCPHFNFAVTKFVTNPSCTNYAVGGGRINTRGDTKAAVDTESPLSIRNQISVGSPFLAASDIVVIDGGANDMADLVGAHLAATTPDGLDSFSNKLSKVLPPAGTAPGSAQRNAVQTSIQTWTNAYNTALAKGLTSGSVLVVDLNSQFTQFLAQPARFGLINTTTPACPKVAGGLDAYGLASLSQLPTVLACNSSNLSDHISVGEASPNWWQSYAFADDLHPTPDLHSLIGSFVLQQMARVGWIAPS